MNRIKRILQGAVALLLCVTLTVPQVAWAAWDPAKATRIIPGDIESGTFAIGTHLIHLSAMSDLLYEEAMRSAAESGQSTIYYKSELANGDWFDVTGAGSIADISTAGAPVLPKTIAALYFTHQTKADGITIDLRTKAKVHVYDIHSAFDFRAMEELTPYLNQVEYLRQTPMYREAYDALYYLQWYGEAMLNSPGSYPTPTRLWNNMGTLDDYQVYLREKNATSTELNLVQEAISYQNAELWYYMLGYIDDKLVTNSNSLVALNEVPKDDDEQPQAQNKAPQSTLDSVGETQSLVKSSLIKWKGKRLFSGSLVAEKYRYRYFTDLITSTSGRPNANSQGERSFRYNHYGRMMTLTETDFKNYNTNSFSSRYSFDEYYDYQARSRSGNFPYYMNGASSVAQYKNNTSGGNGGSIASLLMDKDIARKMEMGADYEAADRALANLLHLEHIASSDIVNRTAELTMLDTVLTPEATNVYLQRMQAGENSDYRTAVTANSSPALLSSLAKSDASSVSGAQAELEYFIEEMLDRMETSAGVALLNKRLVEAKGYYGKVPKGAFRTGTNASIDAHIEFLSRMLAKKGGTDGGEQNKLSGEKSNLQDQLMDALDNSRLSEADELRKQIAALDDSMSGLDADNAAEAAGLEEEIADLEKKIDDADNSGNGDLAGELGNQLGDAKVKLAGINSGTGSGTDGIGGGSLGGLAGDLKKSGLAAIAGGDTSGVDNSLTGLEGMMELEPRLAYPAISSLRDAMVNKRDVDGDNTFGSQIGNAEKLMVDNSDAYNNAMNGNKLEGLLGDYDPNDHLRNTATVGALGQLMDKGGSADVQKLLSQWADNLLSDGNPNIYIRVDDNGNEYIPCKLLCTYTGMRYVWHQSQQTATMSKKGNYYSFTVDFTQVSRDKNATKTEEMLLSAKWQDDIHVPESYTIPQFQAEAYYLPGTRYGVLLTPEIKEMLTEILGTLEGVS